MAEKHATPESVREEAYQAWERAGRPGGDGVRFWLEAEAGMAGRPGAASALERSLAGLSRFVHGDGGDSTDTRRRMTEATADTHLQREVARAFGVALMATHTVRDDGRILWANRAELTLLGYARREYVGHHIAEFHVDRDAIDGILARLARGKPVHQCEARLRCGDGTVRQVLISSSAVRKKGKAWQAQCFTTDVTARRSAERGRAAEHAVMRILMECASFGEARDRLLKVVCEHVEWDMGVIWEIDPDTNLLCCTCIRQAAPDAADRFEHECRQMALPIGVGLPGRVWASGKPCWIENTAIQTNFPRRQAAVADGLQSAFASPICNKDRFFGVIELLSRELHPPDNALLETMAQLGAQIGEWMERSRIEEILHGRERELAVARDIQQALLPKTHPQITAYDVAAASHPAQETGGDYFDFLNFPNGSLGIVVGDASGHGVGPALVIAATRAYLRAFAVAESDPDRLLGATNRCLTADLDETFVTMFVARLDPVARSLTHASAGHWPAYLLGPAGELRACLASTTVPLGMQMELEGTGSQLTPFEPNEILIVLTDGIMEAMTPDGEMFGIERVLDLVRQHLSDPASTMIERLLSELERFTEGRFRDDRTIVVIKSLPTA